ncbi:protamine-2 [Peromyscus californicus insignis]|uniref:protamine-2 n=1 Tax=Peromyscus californicus insignis TaxID=564181 RepID=UPI0022A7E3F2|nr:protamine-2 [Peromyscus californicus insignis]
MVRYRMRSPSERPHQGPGQEHGGEEEQGQELSPERVDDYGRTHRGHHHHRHRRCSRRRLYRIHRRRRSCRRRRRRSCRHRRRHRRGKHHRTPEPWPPVQLPNKVGVPPFKPCCLPGSPANQNFLSQRLQKIPKEEEMQVQEV